MKVSGTPKTPQAKRVSGASAPAAAAPAAPVAPVDKLVLAGIPEAELTPRVREALISLMNEVQTLRAELAQARKRMDDLEKLADRDPLLDILNRRAFVRELDRALAMIDRYDMRASLIFIDLNDLKIVNDDKGHGAGDAALSHVAAVLSSNIRQTDAVGRLGGDEFGVLLTQADHKIAAMKADDLAAKVAAEPVRWNGGEFTARISCGVVEIPKGVSADQAMERADSAMYEKKKKK